MEENIQKLVNAANSTNATAREIGLKKLKELGLDKDGKPLEAAKPKEEKPKAERKKREPKAKEQKPKKADIRTDNDAYCKELIDEAEKRKAKAKAAAEKRASMPKKTPATKNKEAVEKTAGRIEKNVEKRAKKGDVTVSEIEKLISEYEDAIKNLRALITKIKADGKMSMGGGVGESHAAEYRKIKNHTCKCGDKMADGGGIYSSDEVYILKVYDLNGKLLDTKRFQERNIKRAKEYAIDMFEYDMQQKHGSDLRFSVTPAPAMADGGGIEAKKYKKDWEVVGITLDGKKFKKTITLGRLSNKSDVQQAIKRMGNVREVTSITEVKSYAGGGKLVTRNGREYPTGSAWTIEHNKRNKGEKWEQYADGGNMESPLARAKKKVAAMSDAKVAEEVETILSYEMMDYDQTGEDIMDDMKAARKFLTEHYEEQFTDIDITSFSNGGGVGKDRYNLSFNYNPSIVKNEYAENIVSKYTKDWKHDNDWDEVTFYVIGLTKEQSEDLKRDLKMEDVYNIEIDKGAYKYSKGGGVGNWAKEIEIVALSQSGTRGYRIYDTMTNRRAINTDGSYEFDDGEISEIIGEKNMDAFYDGHDKFKPKKKLNFDIFANGGGVELHPSNSLINAVLNHVSSGYISSRLYDYGYGDINYRQLDGVRKKMVDILNERGDEEYSIDRLNKLIKDAALSHFGKPSTLETKSVGSSYKMVRGGGINKKYKYFAVGKQDNKIVDAWELISDVESLKYYAKIDLKDNDLNPKDYKIVSGKFLLSQGINPFDTENWKKR